MLSMWMHPIQLVFPTVIYRCQSTTNLIHQLLVEYFRHLPVLLSFFVFIIVFNIRDVGKPRCTCRPPCLLDPFGINFTSLPVRNPNGFACMDFDIFFSPSLNWALRIEIINLTKKKKLPYGPPIKQGYQNKHGWLVGLKTRHLMDILQTSAHKSKPNKGI